MTQLLSMFTRVTPDCPCPICHRDSWCLVSRRGKMALCQRVESARRKGDAGYVHMLDADAAVKIPPPERVADRLAPGVIETLVMGWMADASATRLRWLSDTLGVTMASLERLNVGWHTRNECYTFPMRNSGFEYVGARYRFANGDKRSLRGASEGLFLPLESLGLPRLYVTEGPTDCAALLDCGLPAIGRPNNIGGIEEVAELVARYRPQQVIVVDDGDKAGALGGARLLARLNDLPRLGGVARLRPARHKDARECVRAGGKRQTIVDTLAGKRNTFWELV